MNCLDGAKYLREALDSVYAQTFDDWEIVFWDNGSTDASAAIARSYGTKVRYFKSDLTEPLGCARNRALRKAEGSYLAFLDCDDLWLPRKLEKQVPLFANPSVGLVFCDTFTFNNAGYERQQFRWRKPPRGRLFADMLNGSFVAQIPGIVIRRDALHNLDEWFDDRFNIVEETDLFTRLAHDWNFDYVDEPLAKWRLHGESCSWKHQDQLPKELELMIDKLCALYPDCGTVFRKDVARMRARTEYHQALVDWKEGNRSAVRRRLRPFLNVERRLMIPFILSFLPYPMYMRLYLSLRLGASLQ